MPTEYHMQLAQHHGSFDIMCHLCQPSYSLLTIEQVPQPDNPSLFHCNTFVLCS